MIATPVTVRSSALTRAADHPRYLEVVVGRLLDLVIHTIEGARERVRGRISVH